MQDVSGGTDRRFQVLYREQARPLLAYALRRVDQPADAADVVAETFLVAWRRMGVVPAGADARPWLFGVARKVMANQRRGGHRRANLADRLRHDLARHVVADPTAEAASAQVVRRAMSALDPDDRELLWLTSWEGLTPAELAIAFDVPQPTARTRLHRARRRLRAELEVLGWGREPGGERSGGAGHVVDDEHPLVRELETDR